MISLLVTECAQLSGVNFQGVTISGLNSFPYYILKETSAVYTQISAKNMENR